MTQAVRLWFADSCAFPQGYLAPGSQCELNIDHNLREELVAYMNKVFADVASREANAMSEPDKLDPVIAAKSMQSSQLQNLVRLYERIQGYIFRLMATDSVPKFCKTDRVSVDACSPLFILELTTNTILTVHQSYEIGLRHGSKLRRVY